LGCRSGILPSDERITQSDVAADVAVPSFCRRWLEYEEAHGTDSDVEGVKQRAMEYMRAQETA
jgi:hypothetical protein